MRRFPKVPVILASMMLSVVAVAASAEQARPRSAPPSDSRSSSSQGSGGKGSSSSSSDRGSSNVQRRETSPAPQAPRNDTRNDTRTSSSQRSTDSRTAPSRNNDSRTNSVRPNDNRSSSDARSNTRTFDSRSSGREVAPQRQAVPAPRDRYMDLNRNGRDDRYEGRSNDGNYRYGGFGYGSSYRDDYYSSSYRYGSSRMIIAPRDYRRFSSSWFSFRPLERLLVGLTRGYPVAFPTWYDPYVVGSNYARPTMAYGGVTFDVDPQGAELWIDGERVGLVSDYSSYEPPLTLIAGRHHVELTGRNYRSIEFDITVVPGQVIPYQGTLPYVR